MREILSESFGTSDKRRNRKRKLTLEDFTFIGMGRDPGPPVDNPVSEDHDKRYAEAIASRWEEPDPRDPRP